MYVVPKHTRSKIRFNSSKNCIEELVTKAIRQGGIGDELSEEALQRLAKGYTKVLRTAKLGDNVSTMRRLDVTDVQYLSEYFEELGEGMGDEIAEVLETVLASKNKNAGKIDRAKSRMILDESAEINIGGGKTLRFTDLLERDVGKLTDRYIQVMSGHMALAKELNVKSKAD